MKVEHRSQAGWWMLCAFVPALLISCVTLMLAGIAAPGTSVALKITARWAYIFFWPAYAGGALSTIFGPRFSALARRGRELGLAFAAAMLPHAALVGWIFYESPTPPMSLAKAVFFLVALAFALALALLSIGRLAAKLAPAALRGVRLVGMEYIALAFLRDFLAVPPHPTELERLAYLPFVALAVAAGLLRLGRVVVTRRRQGAG
jgi:hypothetical protein